LHTEEPTFSAEELLRPPRIQDTAAEHTAEAAAPNISLHSDTGTSEQPQDGGDCAANAEPVCIDSRLHSSKGTAEQPSNEQGCTAKAEHVVPDLHLHSSTGKSEQPQEDQECAVERPTRSSREESLPDDQHASSTAAAGRPHRSARPSKKYVDFEIPKQVSNALHKLPRCCYSLAISRELLLLR